MTTMPVLFEDETEGFESLARSNGNTWWYASDLARMLGYTSYKPFFKAVQKGMAACATLAIPIQDNFRREEREPDNKPRTDYRLSRFACYLTAMNADIRKPQVARAQVCLAGIAETFHRHVQEAGYRGMYNMNLSSLKAYKDHSGNEPLLNFMGRQEWAANMFRLTQTEARIHNEQITDPQKLEEAAFEAGVAVRRAMQEISGNKPEDLLLDESKNGHQSPKVTKTGAESLSQKQSI